MSTILTCSIVGIPQLGCYVDWFFGFPKNLCFELHPQKCIAWFPFGFLFASLFLLDLHSFPRGDIRVLHVPFVFFSTSSPPPLFFKALDKDVRHVRMSLRLLCDFWDFFLMFCSKVILFILKKSSFSSFQHQLVSFDLIFI
jgi:hypothetical protein